MPGVALINAGPLYSRDALDIASHIPPIDLIGGAAIAAVLVLAAADAVGGRIAATIVQISIAVGLYVPVLIQFPDRLGDPFQARVAVGDLLAVAARATPPHDSSPLFLRNAARLPDRADHRGLSCNHSNHGRDRLRSA